MNPRDLFATYLDQINRHEFARIAPLLADDCTFWFTSGTHSGHAAARAAFEKTWAAIEGEVYWASETDWIANSPDAAACTYTYHWKGKIRGEAREGKGRGTSVFRREPGGWKIAHEHLSGFPE